jgi:hypothetical protein
VVEKRLPNELEKILALLSPWPDELVGVVVESTFNWYWLVDGGEALTRTEEGQNKERGSGQGAGAQAGPGALPHTEGAPAF